MMDTSHVADSELPLGKHADRPARVIRLIRPAGEDGVGVFAISGKKDTQFYVFKEIPCDIGGRAFVIHRLGLANVYDVRIGTPAECSCECMGFLRHGKCKHVQGLSALVGHGMI